MVQVGDNYIGTYRRLKLVRQGKACQIWEAMSSDNRRCVLKVLREDHRQNREEIGMLKHEYDVGHPLDHENCIHIYEFDFVRGIPFLALEYFVSLNLKQWLREPTADPKQLPSIVEQAAMGIEHLHGFGWVHRDLKPDNFLINDQGQVKLIDFAIAQKVKKGLSRLFGSRGTVQGTRSYMSPEQIRNESLDERSDVYSFGCVIFELASGKPPYTGANADDLLQRHLSSPVPSLLAVGPVSEPLSTLVGKMMSKKREDRPESIAEFLRQFRALRQPFPVK